MIIKKGFTLIELMITIAIIGILAMMAIPTYNQYIARVETTRTLNDVMIIANDYQMELMAGEYGSGSYTADKLLKIAPNSSSIAEHIGCIGNNLKGLRIQWTNSNEIAKILNNHTSKLTILDIESFAQDKKCTTRNSHALTADHQQTIMFGMDYEKYGIKMPYKGSGNNVIIVFIGGTIEIYDKNGKLEKRLSGNNVRACTVAGNGLKPSELGPRSIYPSACRYTYKNRSGSGYASQVRMLFPF